MTAQTLTMLTNPCQHCGHSPDVHRFDDYRLVEFDYVPWVERPFRCLGADFPYSGHTPCDVACPNYVGDPVTFLPDSEGGEP